MAETAYTEEAATSEPKDILSTRPVHTETTEESATEATTEDLSVERQIVEAICIDFSGKLFSPFTVLEADNVLVEYENDAVWMMKRAEMLSVRELGEISGEDDLIAKARPVWIEVLGAEYIEYIESEFIEVNGEKMRYERNVPPYGVYYYEEYDTWLIVPHAPSGVTEDGGRIATPSEPSYLIIRGEDGMILGACI